MLGLCSDVTVLHRKPRKSVILHSMDPENKVQDHSALHAHVPGFPCATNGIGKRAL